MGRRLAALALLAVVTALWLIPSDVPRLIARQRDVLLGRYSEAHLVAAILLTLLLVPAAFMVWRGLPGLEVAARVVLAAVTASVSFAVASIASYEPAAQRYLETPVAELAGTRESGAPPVGATRRRQPNQRFELRRRDAPGPLRSYPDAPAGFPEARIVLTTDGDGLRNPRPVERCDVVVAGDSFSEGSMVSDDEVWSARLAAARGLRVRNVAMSGASPRISFNNLLSFGASCDPALIVASVYEGNDFKRQHDAAPLRGDTAAAATFSGRVAAWRRLAFKDSPLRFRAKQWLLRTFGAWNRDAPVAPSEGLDWMPVEVAGRAYAFEPGELLRLAVERGRFERSEGFLGAASAYRELAGWARARGVPLLVVYAPSKPRVVLPPIRQRVSDTALRAFAAFEEDDLPPPDRFARELFERLDTSERVFFDFCAREGIACESLTDPLRDDVRAGTQVYFSYDPHWTRLGHDRVAERVAARIDRERWLDPAQRARFHPGTPPIATGPPGGEP